MLAFLDELGHAGRYVARDDVNYQGSPLFGFGGFLIDSSKLRYLVDQIIRQKALYLRRPVKKVITLELKARELFEPNLFTATKPQPARKKVNHIATKSLALLKECDAKVCYYGVEKIVGAAEHDDGALERACLREVIDIIRKAVQPLKLPCVVVIDQHNNHHRKASMIAYSMAANGYFRELAEPPVMADSRVSTAVQVADWIAGLLNKVHIPDTASRADWPELGAYRNKYYSMITAACLPGSRIVFRPAEGERAAS